MATDWKTDEIKIFVIEFCRDNPGKNGNPAIRQAVFERFQLLLTLNQVAGAMHRWGISRGGAVPRKSVLTEDDLTFRPSHPMLLTYEAVSLDRLRLAGQMARYTDIEAARRRHANRMAERRREAKAKEARLPVAAPIADHDHRPIANRPRQTLPSPFSDRVYREPPVTTALPIPRASSVARTCLWPEPVCDEPADEGRPYCGAHCRRAYHNYSGPRVASNAPM